jgi:hypothetical protein
MSTTLSSFLPEVVSMDEKKVLKKFQWDLVSYTVWSPLDLQEWLEDQGLSEYEASNYTNHLLDYMLENDLGYEFGGLTPWMGEGYTLY